MKICPLITQVSILEEPGDVILLGEADDTDLHDEDIGEYDGDKDAEEDEGGDIFMNPDSEASSDEDSDGDSNAKSEEDEGENETGSTGESQDGNQDDDEIAEEKVHEASARPVRFVARSTHGEVRCLGGQCRFYDDKRRECGIEILLRNGSDGDDGHAEEAREAEERLDERLESIRGDLEKSWDFQQRSTGDFLGMFRELEEKTAESTNMMKESFDKNFSEIKELISSVNEDNKLIVESLSDTLAERSEDLDDRLSESSRSVDHFRGEVSNWKESLDESISKIENDMEENRRLAREVSENNSEIMQVVENQKKTLE
jgi:hypothetical protein